MIMKAIQKRILDNLVFKNVLQKRNGNKHIAKTTNWLRVPQINTQNGIKKMRNKSNQPKTTTFLLRRYNSIKAITEHVIPNVDENGKMIDPPTVDPGPGKKNGIVAENGSLYYYVDDVLTPAGLIQLDGAYYYVKTSTCEVVHGRTYWVTATNDLMPAGPYTFGDDGRMIL